VNRCLRSLAAAPLVLAALSSATLAETAPLRIVATVGMAGDIASSIAGPCGAVTTLIGPGADPHLYAPLPSDLRALREADVVVLSGFALEGRFGEVLARLGESRPVVALAEVAADAAGENALVIDPETGAPDPHLWMDPGLWAAGVGPLADRLAAAAPDCAGDIAERADALARELAALDAWAEESLATVPQSARVLVTAHDAFGYFARAYGFRQEAIQGVSTAAEAGIADIDNLARLIADAGIPAVFVESTINPRSIAALTEAVAALGASVTTGGELHADAMGAEGTAAGTYLGMIHHNVVTIARALGGAPAPLPAELAPWAARWGIASGG
jgi:manganese/zinc/iron transport system substrate-binding protein